MNQGQLMIQSVAQSPILSLILIICMVAFAGGFAMTLISTLKAQWSHKKGETRFIGSGIGVLAVSLIVIILVSAEA